MLTQNQKVQLNKDILEYLVKNSFASTAEIFAEEINAILADVDP